VAWREPPLNADRALEMKHARVRQPAWSRRFIAPGDMYGATEHADALQVLGEILSGGATSRLYRTLVVEEKVAVEAGAWYDGDGRGPGIFGFYISPPQNGDVRAAAAAMDAKIKTLIEKGVTEDEVARAVQQLQDSAIYALDSYRTPARVIGGALAVGRTIEDVETWPERIGAVTVDKVNRAIAAVLKDQHSVTALLLPEPTS
jgi:zinc protease